MQEVLGRGDIEVNPRPWIQFHALLLGPTQPAGDRIRLRLARTRSLDRGQGSLRTQVARLYAVGTQNLLVTDYRILTSLGQFRYSLEPNRQALDFFAGLTQQFGRGLGFPDRLRLESLRRRRHGRESRLPGCGPAVALRERQPPALLVARPARQLPGFRGDRAELNSLLSRARLRPWGTLHLAGGRCRAYMNPGRYGMSSGGCRLRTTHHRDRIQDPRTGSR